MSDPEHNPEKVAYLIAMQNEYVRLVQEGVITDALSFYSWLSTFPAEGGGGIGQDRLGRAMGLDLQSTGKKE